MATQGIKLKDKNNNVLLPATSGDLVEVKYGGTSRILSSLLEEIEETTADALSDLSDEVAAKQSTLISGTNIKTINNNSVLGQGNLAVSSSDPTTVNDMSAATTFNQAMAPNTIYVVGSTSNNVTSFTATALTSTNSNYAEYYHAIIYCGDNMTFTIPAGVKMADNRTLPAFASGYVFEFSIFRNILIYTYTSLS